MPSILFLPDLLAALPAKILGLSVYQLYQFYDFLWPAILFILIFLIANQLIKNKTGALLLSSWIMLVNCFFDFNRPISPQFVFIFALSFIFLLLLVLIKDKPIYGYLAGINFGLLFYIYLYYWTYLGALLGLMFLYFIFVKNYSYARKIFSVGLVGFMVGIPYFILLWVKGGDIDYQDLTPRVGLIHTRFPSSLEMMIWAAVFLAIFVLFWFFKKNNLRQLSKIEVLLFCGVSSIIVSNCQQVITGINLLFTVHYKMISYFFILFSLIYLIFQNKKAVSWLKSNLVKFIIIMIILVGFISQLVRVSTFDYLPEINSQRYGAIYDWLNANGGQKCVVMSDQDYALNELVPAYTNCDELFAGNGNFYNISAAEVLDRFVVNNYRVKNFDADYIKKNYEYIFGIHDNVLAGNLHQRNMIYKIFDWPQVNEDEIRFSREKIDQVINLMDDMDQAEWLNRLKQYQVRYLVYDSTVDGNWLPLVDINKFGVFKKVFSANNIDIYQIEI